MARPKKIIDEELLRKLARIHCTTSEIASVLGCQRDLVERRYTAIIKEEMDKGCMSLKRKQFEVALGGNVTMLIWLGKIFLKQREEATTSVTINNNPNPKTDTDINQIKEILKATECSYRQSPQLSLVPSQGLLSP